MTKLRPSTTLVLISLLLLPTAAFAAPETEIAEVENQGTVLVFYPFVEYEALILTVTGPCDYRHRTVFDRGETPFWKIEEEVTIDGIYTYQLLARPFIDSSIVEELQQARKNFDEETPKKLCRQGRLPGDPLVQAQGFTVANFKIVFDPGSSDEAFGAPLGKSGQLGGLDGGDLGDYFSGDPAAKDFLINDDLIVDGSACIGFDCVNGESFGFDTIRLKENNLRIKFDDTSVAASFPRNDWQLTANASANGGANKFSIDDISGGRTPFTVEANAPSHSLYVDDGGRIGNRTSTPVADVHVVDGDTPTVRLEQNGSSGFAPQTWDMAGNETSFFIRDATNGSTLPFRIRPGSPSQALVIDQDGDIGINTLSADQSLHVFGTAGDTQVLVEETGAEEARDLIRLENNGTARIAIEDTSADGEEWQFAINGGADSFVITNQGSGGTEFSLRRNNAGTNPGRLTILGDIVTGGGTCGGGCDAVFDGEIESIEEHAASMWENSFLPAVGPTGPNEPWNLTEKTSGILNELEKAHIYIEQLHKGHKEKDSKIADLEGRLAKIEASQERLLAQIEALLGAQAD